MKGLLCIVLFSFVNFVAGSLQVGSQIEVISGSTGACIRMYKSDGSVGCSTPRGGIVAPIYGIESQAHLNDFIDNVPSESGPKYGKTRAIALGTKFFTKENVQKLKATNRLAGILVLQDDAQLYSPASDQNGFNKNGAGFLVEAMDYPIVLVDAANSSSIRSFAEKNRQRTGSTLLMPQYLAQFDFYMGPELSQKVDVKQCLEWTNLYKQRDPHCSPIGGQSVWGYMKGSSSQKVVMGVTGIDSASLFYGKVPGFDASTSSTVALLLAAQALKPVMKKNPSALGIAFAFFQGESYGRIGSTRFVHDVESFKCKIELNSTEAPAAFGGPMCLDPIAPSLEFRDAFAGSLQDRVQHVVAIDQVAYSLNNQGSNDLFVHASTTNDELLNGLTSAGLSGLKPSSRTGLPPSPLDSFTKQNSAQSGVVISGYDQDYSEQNNYFHSYRDNVTNGLEGFQKAAAVISERAEQIARALYLAANAYTASTETFSVNRTFALEMLQCVSSNWTCVLMQKYYDSWERNTYTYLKDSGINGFSTSVPKYSFQGWSSPPTLYTGPVDNKLPLLWLNSPGSRGQCDHGNGALCYSGYRGTFDKTQDYAVLLPTLYEIFLQTALAEATATDESGNCTNYTGCTSSGSTCVLGICAHARSYFHDALSPAISIGADFGGPGLYSVNSTLQEAYPETLWAEPIWSVDIGTKVYPDGGVAIAWISFSVGIVVFGISIIAARYTSKQLQHKKLL